MASQWEQRADYVNACNWQAPDAVQAVYNPPRPVGRESAADVTNFHYGQSTWNDATLPEVAYILKPDHHWQVFKNSGRSRVPQMMDANGNPRFEQWPRPGTTARKLLDFPILRGIEKIGTEEYWWWFEIIRRLDPRITHADLTMRMELTGLRKTYNDKQFVDRVFNNKASRTMRPAFKMLNWHSKLQGGSKSEGKTLSQLSAQQINQNTTRGSTPGLTDPNMPEGPNNQRVPVPVFTGTKGINTGVRANAGGARHNPLATKATSTAVPTSSTNESPASIAASKRSHALTTGSSDIAASRRSGKRVVRQNNDRAIPDPTPATLGSELPVNPVGAPSGETVDNFASPPAPSFGENSVMLNGSPHTMPPNPYAQLYVYPPTPSAMQSEAPTFEAPEGFYTRRHSHATPRSQAPLCQYCGQPDPHFMHLSTGCQTDPSAMGPPPPPANPFVGPYMYPDPNQHGTSNQMSNSSSETSNSSPLEPHPYNPFQGSTNGSNTQATPAQGNIFLNLDYFDFSRNANREANSAQMGGARRLE